MALIERQRAWPERNPAAFVGRDRGGALPRAGNGRLPPGMRQLNTRHRAEARDKLGKPAQKCRMGFIPKPQALGRNATDGRDMGRLGEDDPRAAGRMRAQMLHMPIIAQAVASAVLAHGRNHDAVAGCYRTEAKGLKEERGCGHSKKPPSRLAKICSIVQRSGCLARFASHASATERGGTPCGLMAK